MGAEPTTARSGADVAAEAWLLLSVALLAQRPVWLAAAQAEGLTPPQAISLMRLDDTAPPSLGDIARHMRCDASQATVLADRLEERGFAERRTAAGDRRVKELVLTEEGRLAQGRLREAYRRPPARLADVTPDDLEALLRVARTLAGEAGADVLEMFGLAAR